MINLPWPLEPTKLPGFAPAVTPHASGRIIVSVKYCVAASHIVMISPRGALAAIRLPEVSQDIEPK